MYYTSKKMIKSLKDSKQFLEMLENTESASKDSKRLFKNSQVALQIAIDILENINKQNNIK